ncbi:MAG: hypothetical protein Q7T03_10720 [Deltaproteobacteria bacterium]|nr:hypothetical protein [Deltaproteobacteria bacterium]
MAIIYDKTKAPGYYDPFIGVGAITGPAKAAGKKVVETAAKFGRVQGLLDAAGFGLRKLLGRFAKPASRFSSVAARSTFPFKGSLLEQNLWRLKNQFNLVGPRNQDARCVLQRWAQDKTQITQINIVVDNTGAIAGFGHPFYDTIVSGTHSVIFELDTVTGTILKLERIENLSPFVKTPPLSETGLKSLQELVGQSIFK